MTGREIGVSRLEEFGSNQWLPELVAFFIHVQAVRQKDIAHDGAIGPEHGGIHIHKSGPFLFR